MITPHKQIMIKESTSKRINEYKLIESESYDSVINRILDEVEVDARR
jgi:hypothetical protein